MFPFGHDSWDLLLLKVLQTSSSILASWLRVSVGVHCKSDGAWTLKKSIASKATFAGPCRNWTGIGADFWCEHLIVTSERCRYSPWLFCWFNGKTRSTDTLDSRKVSFYNLLVWIKKLLLKFETSTGAFTAYSSVRSESVWQISLMVCLSSLSLRLLLPNCLQAFWAPGIERTIDEDLEQTIPNAANPYTLTEPAVYELENIKPAPSPRMPLPVCNPKPTEKEEASKISSIEECHSESFLISAKLLILPSHSAIFQQIQQTYRRRILCNQTATLKAESLCSLISLHTFDLLKAGLLTWERDTPILETAITRWKESCSWKWCRILVRILGFHSLSFWLCHILKCVNLWLHFNSQVSSCNVMYYLLDKESSWA